MKNLKTLWILLPAILLLWGCEPLPQETEEVTVTFNADGGSPTPPPLTIEKGSGMGAQYPADPEKTDNTFNGWFNEGTQYTGDTPINNDLTLTAGWQLTSTTTSVAFTDLTQNGSASATTTKLTLTFDKDIAGLTAADITLNTGTTGASKGALSRTGTGVYDVALSGITANGSVTVNSVTKSGYTVTGTPKSVTIFAEPAEGPDGTPVRGSWRGITIPARTIAQQHSTFQGKNDVLQVAPATQGYDWAVLSYNLNAYAGTTVTISVSMQLWLETPAEAAWQVNQNPGYPTVAGKADTGSPYSAGQWHTISGSKDITVAPNNVLYLSGQQLDNARAYIADLSITINGTEIIQSPDSSAEDMMSLPPMKTAFATAFGSNFLLGNIVRSNGDLSGSGNNSAISNTRLTRHFNVLTSENNMKPSTYGGNRSGSTVSGLTYTNSDAFVAAVNAAGMKVHAHVLLWHSQNSGWITSISGETNKATALGAMQSYITQVVQHFAGKVYSWDVLNEVFPDGVSSAANWRDAMRTTGDGQAANPWYVAIGADFVFEGFKAARLADTEAILYYNDYNLNDTGKATMVRNMVRDVNQQWLSDPAYDGRLLIEGIGMQSHHNTSVSAVSVKASLDLFQPLGVKISISELDVLSQSWSDYNNSVTPTETGRTAAANLYYDYIKVFMQYSAIIERITFWGVYDEQSWRARGEPLPFKGNPSTAKPAYYKIIEALEAR